jgi:hypothetical protein
MLAYIALIIRSSTTIRDIIIDTVIILMIREIMLIMIIMISINIIMITVRRG